MANRTLTLTAPIRESSRKKKKEEETVPLEIIEQILSRLPVGTLSQSRFVCQRWRSLINDPRISKMHYSNSCQNPKTTNLILFSYQEKKLSVYCIPDFETCDKAIKLNTQRFTYTPWFVLDVVGSVNGFICLADSENHQFRVHLNFIICNPVSGDWFKLPEGLDLREFGRYFFGFGWGRTSNQYKVMVMYEHNNDGLVVVGEEEQMLACKILTLGENTWRSVGLVKANVSSVENAGVFVDGHLHWLLTDTKGRVVGVRAFSVEEEKFYTFPAPSSIKGIIASEFVHLGLLNNCLMLVYSSPKYVQVWTMEDCDMKECSWVRELLIPKLNVGVQTNIGVHPRRFLRPDFLPLGVQKNGNVILQCVEERGGWALSSYDPQTRKHEKLSLNGIPRFYKAISHMGTLVTLKDVITME